MSSLILPPHLRRRPRGNGKLAELPEWARRAPDAFLQWRRLQQALALIQGELPRVDQKQKLAALVELAFTIGRAAETEAAKNR